MTNVYLIFKIKQKKNVYPYAHLYPKLIDGLMSFTNTGIIAASFFFIITILNKTVYGRFLMEMLYTSTTKIIVRE